MFRWDNLTVKREVYETKDGEATDIEPVTILENVKCHLSGSLNNTFEINGAPFVSACFTLFLNYSPDIKIMENDILYVTTSRGQKYKLYSGEVKIYNLTIQIKCKQEKNIESKEK